MNNLLIIVSLILLAEAIRSNLRSRGLKQVLDRSIETTNTAIEALLNAHKTNQDNVDHFKRAMDVQSGIIHDLIERSTIKREA